MAIGLIGMKQTAFLTYTLSGSNPTLTDGGETSLFMEPDGITVVQFYRITSTQDIEWRTANNALLDNWGSPTACDITGLFPTCFKIGSTFYMFLGNQVSGRQENIYLYSSTNKTNWTILNSGNPVIEPDRSSTSNWNYYLYNVGVAVVGSDLHILVEGSADDSGSPYYFPAALGYATANISSPVFTLPSTPTIENGFNPEIVYSSDRAGFTVLYNDMDMDLSDLGTSEFWSRPRAMRALLSTDLTLTSSWGISPLLFPSIGVQVVNYGYAADQSFLPTPGKTYGSLVTFNWAQSTGYQGYPNVSNETELFDYIP